MKGILADVNIQGHVDLLVVLMQAEPWKLFWDYLHLRYVHFADVGLAPSTLDSMVWDTCQKEELVLITDNRNMKGTDSLEQTMREEGDSTSLPVITVGSSVRLKEAAYRAACATRLVEIILDLGIYRGAHRLYIP